MLMRVADPAKKLVTFPADLLAEVKRRAEEQGVSANSLIVNLVAGGVRWKLPKK